ncbi:hypothetical protein [Vitiosangium sp. GDMCC 1.1324]|uniref:hypothetical protein n=1 Tax=Vitiosangium sp. (strain GDMCC 1.1324) TaxID=2138576 RepID=UPI000D372BBB|nr:hypothetical protein [Vitiosangium sp. GDMCC 1.1324]PTL85410.1 hypothetical protein DAT35_01440 [Vitiosangium sp. GDMCC 1.1324]
MRHALAFLTAALLFTGCHKNTGESPTPPADARDSGQTGSTESTLSATAPSGGGDKAQAGTKAQTGGKAAVEACVDRWLQEHKLDNYGHPEGTMYAGGTPLFNEATGETRDRLEYVFSRQPEARKACAEKNAQ